MRPNPPNARSSHRVRVAPTAGAALLAQTLQHSCPSAGLVILVTLVIHARTLAVVRARWHYGRAEGLRQNSRNNQNRIECMAKDREVGLGL